MAFRLIDRGRASAQVRLDGAEVPFADPVQGRFDPAVIVRPRVPPMPEPGRQLAD